MRRLVAEDDRALAMFLTRGLEADGHRVRCAADGAEAVSFFFEEMPDLTILDLNLPVMDGEEALRAIRRLDPQLPVLVLTGRQEVETRIRCLDLGADDLMIKPFSLHELRARCRALLRRKREAKLMLRVGDLELDRLDHTARRGGEPITLTNKEFALMEHLMLHRGQCVSRVELLDAVWNMEPAQTTNIVDVYQMTGAGSTRQVNHPTTARVPEGAMVERMVPFDLKQMHTISVVLNDADFHTAERMAGAINAALKPPRAHAADSRRVEIVTEPAEDLPALLDTIEAVEINVYPRARVVINERTGTVVIGGKVRLQPVSILHGGLSINVVTETKVSQPGPFSSGTTQVTQQATIQAVDKPVNHIELKEGATVEDLVQELQQIGASARDVISILQGMKEAGALEADLEVL
jgi:DNA-binding response OmpR family regulator